LPDNYIQTGDLEEEIAVTQEDLLIDEMLINLESDES